MDNKKQVKLKVIGAIFIIIGVLSLVSIFLTPGVLQTTPLQIFWFIWGFLFLIAGIGIIGSKNWARILAIGLVTTKTIQILFGAISDTKTLIKIHPDSSSIYFGVGYAVLVFVLGCWLIFYLSSPKRKKQFK